MNDPRGSWAQPPTATPGSPRTPWRLSLPVVVGIGVVLITGLVMAFAPKSGSSFVFAGNDVAHCPIPVDVSLVFDHTRSMTDVPNKLENAKAAAKGFVDAFAGGPSDKDLSPHQMALTGFHDGIANTDVSLTTDASAMRTAINGFGANGRTNIGRGLQLGQLQLLPPNDTDPSPDANDYMVLLSDGAANEPQKITDSGAQNDFYIDVNKNGYIDSGDNLSVDFTNDGDADFVVVGGLLQVTRNGSSPTSLLDT